MTLLICCWTTFTCVHYWCSSLKAKTICLIGNSIVSSRINIIPGADCTIICLSVWSLVTSQPAWNVKLDFLFWGLAKCLKPTKTKLVHPCWHFHHIWLLNVETEIFCKCCFPQFCLLYEWNCTRAVAAAVTLFTQPTAFITANSAPVLPGTAEITTWRFFGARN